MLSCCFFVQASFNLLELSTYPVLLCFLHCLLNPPVCFPAFFCSLMHTASSSNLSSYHRGREHLWWPMAFSCGVLSQVSHWLHQSLLYCSGNHGIHVHVLITQSNESCEHPIYRCLKKCKLHLGPSACQDQTLVLAGLAFSPSSDELERSSSPGHGHFLCLLQENSLSYWC